MRQRVMIAIAIAAEPELIIADEPTTALDATVQAQILDLLLEIRERHGTAIMLITHDMGVIAEVADRVSVMYAGQVMETAAVGSIFARPRHPYTAGLLASIPSLEGGHRSRRRPADDRRAGAAAGAAAARLLVRAALLARAGPLPAAAPAAAGDHGPCRRLLLPARPRGGAERHRRCVRGPRRRRCRRARTSGRGGAAMTTVTAPLVQASRLTKHYPVAGGRTLHAVEDVDFEIAVGETFAVVGETGSGKSTMGRLVLGLEQPTDGHVSFGEVDLASLSGSDLRALRREMQPVSQDPYSALNPRMTIRQILAEPFQIHRVARGQDLDRRLAELLDLIGLPSSALGRFPHEFSGGQRQRVAIARAIALRPRFVVCDEPVSALDVSVQAQILNLLRHLQRELHLTYMVISHDLAVVRLIADHVAVMYLGRLVEGRPPGPAVRAPHAPVHAGTACGRPRARPDSCPPPPPRASARRGDECAR